MAGTFSSSSSTIWSGVSVASGSSPQPSAAPKGLIATRAVEMKNGWVGQLIVADDIVFETKPKKTADEAEREATKRVTDRLKSLLS